MENTERTESKSHAKSCDNGLPHPHSLPYVGAAGRDESSVSYYRKSSLKLCRLRGYNRASAHSEMTDSWCCCADMDLSCHSGRSVDSPISVLSDDTPQKAPAPKKK